MNDTFLIVGLGSIGRRHLECLRMIRPEAKIVVWRQYHKNAEIPQGADAVVFCLEDALAWEPQVAIVANPATLHIETAMCLARHGLHLLVEKPLSTSLQGVDQLIGICEERGLVLMVAYILRFNESLIFFKQTIKNQSVGRVVSVHAEVGQYLPGWRPGIDYRDSVSARRELGGGALLELSHELDYVRWIFGEVYSVQGSIENTGLLDINVDDLVNLIMELHDDVGNKTIVTVHLDMLQTETKRFCRVIGEHGMLEWDAVLASVRQYNPDSKCWNVLFEPDNISGNAMYVSQLKSFLRCVEAGSKPCVTTRDGRAVLEVIEAARLSASKNRTVFIA